MSLPNRLFGLLLRLYPRRFRDRYEKEMRAFVREERAAGAGGAGYWLRLVSDHVRASLAVRRGGGDGMMRKVWEDLTGGVRSLRRAPGFALFAVLTLALGVGATTAVFSVLDRVVLRPLPYPGSDRMLLVGIDTRHDPGGVGPLSGPLMDRLAEAPGPAEAVVAASSTGTILQDGGEPARMQVTRVTTGFFRFFDARAAVGRLPDLEDFEATAGRVVVLGHGLWRDRYGSDPGVVGRVLHMDGEPVTVVGVLSDAFVPPPEVVEAKDLWIPLPRTEATQSPGTFFLAGVARLRPGATADQMDAYVDGVVADVYASDQPTFLAGGSVASYRDTVVGDVGQTLGRVLAAVLLLLLIACVNVASLLLTRGAQRAHELAVRVALGAGRRRLVRQLLGESTVLALTAGVLGCGLAWGVVELFRRYAPAGIPRLDEVGVDLRGLFFSLAVAAVTLVAFGLWPALRAVRSAAPGPDMAGRRTTGGRRERRIRNALVAVETALAVVLAVGSGLLAHDLVRLSREDPGFRRQGLVTMRLDLAPRFQREEWVAAWEQLLEGAREVPGVTAAAVATQAPYAGTRMVSMYRPEAVETQGEFVVTVTVGGDYPGTLGAPVLEGRSFTAEDDGSTQAILVNEAFVRRYWPGESGVGRQVRSGAEGIEDESVYRVVGVLADVRTKAGAEPGPHVFLPLRESPWRDMEVLVRTEADAQAVAPALREVARRLDPALPVTRISTVEGLASEGLARPRFYAALFGGFAAVALLLAVVGVYGTTSYVTRTRTREIGIRLALGARRRQVVGGTVARTGAVLVLGVATGLMGAALATRAMAGVLTYVTPTDALPYGAVAVLVLAAGLVAAWVPAGRAGRVDPAATLREE